MINNLLVIYLAFISLGLPDSLLESAWPVMRAEFGVMLLPINKTLAMGGIVAIGVGCAPIYPCLIHSTPDHFGVEKSQAVIGIQMASAYLGACLMPPLFGVLATVLSVGLMPYYLLALLALMFVTHEQLNRG